MFEDVVPYFGRGRAEVGQIRGRGTAAKPFTPKTPSDREAKPKTPTSNPELETMTSKLITSLVVVSRLEEEEVVLKDMSLVVKPKQHKTQFLEEPATPSSNSSQKFATLKLLIAH
ncbi:unnamed protein product [Cochlearia groenlandica]